MPIEAGTKNTCRYCERGIVFRLPRGKDGEPYPFAYRPEWFHDDDRPDHVEGDGNFSGTGRKRCRAGWPNDFKEGEGPYAAPTTVCDYEQNDGTKCGRKIPQDNVREEVYACGIHAKHERQRIAQELSRQLAREREVAEGDLRAWARENIGKKVAMIIEAGLPVKWDSGEKDGSYGRERDPSFGVLVNIDDLLEWINAHPQG